MLDLTENEIPFLEEVRYEATAHMTRWYGYDSSLDNLQMYAHFPTQNVTSTLHIHVTLNRKMDPMEEAKSFHLNDIIDCLERGGTMVELVLERSKQSLGLLTERANDVIEQWIERADLETGLTIEYGYFDADTSKFTPSRQMFPRAEIRTDLLEDEDSDSIPSPRTVASNFQRRSSVDAYGSLLVISDSLMGQQDVSGDEAESAPFQGYPTDTDKPVKRLSNAFSKMLCEDSGEQGYPTDTDKPVKRLSNAFSKMLCEDSGEQG
eukprot:TRINITY_DN3689_c0_g1_i3.p1 TRINITY_DN3689_c0_g1~~TRINITY_DN3689_c0_g1_i3.p1  ORF type:complete len:264 (+),score=43.54 TRINITY_DN3689_c0_g1_i3:1881-2672(+)